MDQEKPLVRGRPLARAARAGLGRLGLIAAALAGVVALNMSFGCTFQRQRALPVSPASPVTPHFEADTFVSFDGARLGLTVWAPDPDAHPKPVAVIVAVHGMSEWADAWHLAGPWWAEHGIAVYAYDQRGFGRSPERGIWAGEDLLAADVIAAVTAARAAHPGVTLAVVGESMGSASVLAAAGESSEPLADRIVLGAPAVRGWKALPWTYKVSLWFAAHLAPRWSPEPPRNINIVATDNTEALLRNGRDPLFLHHTRMDTVYGLVGLMQDASVATPAAEAPTLVLYGANDQLVPKTAVEAMVPNLGPCARSAYYAAGWHMLFRDLQAETVWRDVAAFIAEPDDPLPSGAPPIEPSPGSCGGVDGAGGIPAK